MVLTNSHTAGHVAFGEDIWMVDPDELTLGLKVRRIGSHE